MYSRHLVGTDPNARLRVSTRWSLGIASLCLATAGLLAAPSVAEACGGFFCAQSAPVDQSAERILFVDRGDGTIETHVQIAYQGPSEDFSWILPTPSEPEIGLGTDSLFQALESTTTPRLQLDRRVRGTCAREPEPDAFVGADASVDLGTVHDSGSGGVDVVEIGQTGPFDFAVLRADAVRPMVRWLETNGYDVVPGSEELLGEYIMGDMHFVAFKLRKSESTGDIQPVVITYESDEPMIPIKLTAVAARPDMRVTTWILGDDPFLPRNYLIAEPEPLWIAARRTPTNVELLSDAIDEAGSHAFVREFSGEAEVMRERVWRAGFFDESAFRETTDPIEYWSLLLDVSSRWPQSEPQLLSLLQFCIPMPDELTERGVTPQQFFNNLWSYEEHVDREAFDARTCTDRLMERIVEPRREAQELFGAFPELSRMSTFLDPSEMTVDPTFCREPEAGVVEPIYRATETIYCIDGGLFEWESPRSIEIDDATVYFGPTEDGGLVSLDERLTDIPRLRRAWRSDCAGGQETTIDNSETISELVAAASTWLEENWSVSESELEELIDDPRGGDDVGTDTGSSDDTGIGTLPDGGSGVADAGDDSEDEGEGARPRRDDGGCAVAGTGAPATGWFGLVALAVAVARRRR